MPRQPKVHHAAYTDSAHCTDFYFGHYLTVMMDFVTCLRCRKILRQLAQEDSVSWKMYLIWSASVVRFSEPQTRLEAPPVPTDRSSEWRPTQREVSVYSATGVSLDMVKGHLWEEFSWQEIPDPQDWTGPGPYRITRWWTSPELNLRYGVNWKHAPTLYELQGWVESQERKREQARLTGKLKISEKEIQLWRNTEKSELATA